MNKVLVTICVPLIEKKFDVYIPINKKIAYIKILLESVMPDLSEGNFRSVLSILYNKTTGIEYNEDILVKDSDIRNGTQLLLL
jgi:hypothetical protein